MGSRSNTAGRLALAAATCGALGAVALVALSDPGGTDTVQAVVRADVARASTDVRATTGLERVGPRLDAPADPAAARAAAVRALDPASEGLRATLRVVDDRTGLPIEDAWFQRSEFGALDRRARRHEVGPGRGPVVLVVEESRATILVAAPRYATKDVLIDRAGAHEVRLERATSLVGTVRDGHSAPIESARVSLEFLGQSLDGLTDESEAIPIKGTTLRRTDARGEYVFSNLQPGVYRTVCEIDGTRHVSRPHQLFAGEWQQVDHWLDEATRLVVQVDGPDGLPAARARLLLAAPGAETPELTRYTDEGGRATLGPLDPGTYDVSVQSTDGVTDPQSLTIEDDGRAIVDLHVQLARASARVD